MVKSLLSPLIFLLSFSTAHAENDLAGKWYGQRIENDNLLHWLINRKVDGTYKLYFKECHGNNLDWFQNEAGDWSFENGRYKTITKLLVDKDGPYQPDTPDKVYVEEYEVISLSDETFVYKHLHKDKRYKVFKMLDDFELGCVSAI